MEMKPSEDNENRSMEGESFQLRKRYRYPQLHQVMFI